MEANGVATLSNAMAIDIGIRFDHRRNVSFDVTSNFDEFIRLASI